MINPLGSLLYLQTPACEQVTTYPQAPTESTPEPPKPPPTVDDSVTVSSSEDNSSCE